MKNEHQAHHCPHCHVSPWDKRLILVFLAICAAGYLSTFYISQAETGYPAFAYGIREFVDLVWWAVAIGIIFGGSINYFVPNSYVSYYLGGTGVKPVVGASLLGVLFDGCSHGMLVIAMSLYRSGASVASTIAFLIASPWNSISLNILLVALFGWKGLLFIAVSFVIAVASGLILQVLEKRGIVQKSKFTVKTEAGFNIHADAKRRLRNYFSALNFQKIRHDTFGMLHSSWSLAKPILKWILFGIILVAAVRAFLNIETFALLFGPTVKGLLATVAFATVLEVCSEGSSMVAFDMVSRAKAFGNAFAFLMTGVSTDYTELGAVNSVISRRVALLIPLITVPQILLIAWLFNMYL